MEKDQNNKVVDKEINSRCVVNIEAKWNTKSFSYSTTGWRNYLNLDGMPSNKPSHIHSSIPSDHPSVIPLVDMSEHQFFCQLLHQPY